MPNGQDSGAGRLRLGVIGDPVAHSLSPALHQPALDMLGIPATYERWHTPAAELAARIASLRGDHVLGANVTVPHKVAVIALIDEVSITARRAGAVNTIVSRDGRLLGDNTDIHGFETALQQALGGRAPGTALVLGAGGAARAAVLGLEAMAADQILVVNRDLERAERLLADLGVAAASVVASDEAALAQALSGADVLINATSLGWRAGEMPLPASLMDRLPAESVVFDMTYRDTDLLRAAAARNLVAADGLAMLVHQGARAFTLFTGRDAPVAVMQMAAQAARDGAA